MGHGEDAAVQVRDTAALAVSARGADAAEGLIAEKCAVVDARGRDHGHGRGESSENVVRDCTAPAVLGRGTGAGGTADGFVVEERAVAYGDDRVAKTSDVPD